MLLVFPETSAIHHTSYLSPELYGYYPSRDHQHPYGYGLSPFTAPSDLDFFYQPLAEELEEHEYQRALEIIANHRRRQAEEEAAIRPHQLAEAAFRQSFAASGAELEQRQQEEFLVARHAELLHSPQVRAPLFTAEHQHTLNALLQQFKGAQPSHAAKREPVADVLKQGSTTDSDSQPINNVIPSPESRSAESEDAKPSGEDASKLFETFLSSVFPGFFFPTQPQPTSSTEQAQHTENSVSDKGKGKARAVDVEEPQKPAPESDPADEVFANVLRNAMKLSKCSPTRRSPDEAGPSGSSTSTNPFAQQTVTHSEQAQIARAIALSSVEHIQNSLAKLQSGFVIPTQLGHHVPSTTKNELLCSYQYELNELLTELDTIDSNGDVEVREKRKEVVEAIKRALEDVEHVVGEALGKGPFDGPLKGSNGDGSTNEEVIPGQEPGADAPLAVGDVVIPDTSTSAHLERTAVVPAEASFSATDLPESDFPTISEVTTDPISSESVAEASTTMILDASVELKSVTEDEFTERQVQTDFPERVDGQGLSFGEDAETSSWTEFEN